MKALVRSCRDELLSTRNTICLERARLVTEAYQLYEDQPRPLVRAQAFRHVLGNMTLDLHSNPVFAGNTSTRPRAWMLLPEYGFGVPGQAVVENPSLEGFLGGDAIPADIRSFWAGRSSGGSAGVGHLSVDYTKMLSHGLESVIADIQSLEANDYRQAMAISCQAIIDWAARYADAAERVAQTESDEVKRQALLRVSAACRQVPAKPARDLFEALQAIVLVHLGMHIEGHGYSVSPGLLDRVLLPYYADDADTVDLLAAFMLKLTANSVWGSHSKTQAITLGGVDADGKDACNPLTLQFLDACDLIRVPDPHIFLRWHSKIDPAVKRRAIELLGSGLSMPLLVGDEQTLAGFVNAGIPERDAALYCVIGCNELGISGKMADSASGPTINDLAVFSNALLEIESPESIQSMRQLAGVVSDAYRRHIERVLTNEVGRYARGGDRQPTPFTSCFMDLCIERGCDFQTQMLYSRPIVMENGFTNVVNSLTAIEHAVFGKKLVSLQDVLRAMKDNLSDDFVVAALKSAPRWGNDDDRADKWAIWWADMRLQAIREVEKELGTGPHLTGHLVRSTHHIRGKGLGASPDCRPADAPLADSIGAQTGTASAGPTAILKSVLKLRPATYWPGGTNLNLTLPPIRTGDDAGVGNLEAMVEAFFSNGGQELQINCLDARRLREARKRPDQHRDLLVRIAGFNAIFVDLSPVEQDELIERAGLIQR